ncbi:C40 family peptidase [Terrisporobacter sp.]|uniref:C40 family peptidase n=1 Tax=Terrisporobacter sp. TaxID=1965305 RepID=UPI0028A1A5AC|nr:SH3 domain-containing protein [Terrisporobacter sp.]
MNTKVITAIGVGTLALSLGHSSVSAQGKGTVTVSALNIRSGPGTDTSIKGCLHKGDVVAILEKSDGWLNVQLPNKGTGWVSDKYIQIESASLNAKIKCKVRLNVRSGPGKSYEIKTTVKNGTMHKITDKSNGWYKIQLSNGNSGWVHGSYIEETTGNDSSDSNDSNNDSNKPEGTPETEVNLNGKVTSSVNLNVRSGPGTNYSVKTYLKPGQVVFLLSESNGWYKVKLSNDTIGWASSSYISKSDTYGKSTDSLNVRSGPGTNHSVKTALKKGEVVTITNSSNSWYQIKTSSNITGWVSSKYINITTESPGDNTSGDNTSSESKNESVVNLAMAQLGKPYVWGGNGPNSFDCSGFTSYVYLHARGTSLPRISYDQARVGTAVGTSNLKKGDLLHFATVTPGRTSHVGIYIGNNQFIHASGSQTRPDKVKIDSLSGYYGKVLLGARRF